MRDFSNFFDGLITVATVDFDNHNGFSPAFHGNIHLGDIDTIAGKCLRNKGNHTWNILMNDDDSRCIHIERDSKAIEFGYLNISSTDRNTSHTDGLVGILTVILVVLG